MARQLEWITLAGIGALISAVALVAAGVAGAVGRARWGRIPASDDPQGQLVYAAAHAGYLPFVHLLLAVSTLLLLGVAGGLYHVVARRRPVIARIVMAAGLAGALTTSIAMAIQAVAWAVLAAPYGGDAMATVRLGDAQALHDLTAWTGALQTLGYALIALWIVTTGVLLWPVGRDVRSLAALSVAMGVATPLLLPALAVWTFAVGIWLLSPGPRLALLRAASAARDTGVRRPALV